MSIVLPQPTPPNMYSPRIDGRPPVGLAVPCSPDCARSSVPMLSSLQAEGAAVACERCHMPAAARVVVRAAARRRCMQCA